MGAVLVGTSGWTYRDWRGRFYPDRLPQREWLTHYTGRFSTVELNVTTYRLPTERDIARCLDVPQDFVYTIKLSRLITHRNRPDSRPEFVANYYRAIEPLAPKIANVLAQFPPRWERNDDALRGFLAGLPRRHPVTVEFRHPSWYAPEVYAILRKAGVSLCLHDMAGSVAPHVLTGPTLYVRLHGPVRAYAGSYRRARMERWADAIAGLAPQTEAAYVYFNNDERAFATRNAETLITLLRERGVRTS